MSKDTRKRKKWREINRHEYRRLLVHAAGCTLPRCVTRLAVFDDELDVVKEALKYDVRIPRSIMKKFPEIKNVQ